MSSNHEEESQHLLTLSRRNENQPEEQPLMNNQDNNEHVNTTGVDEEELLVINLGNNSFVEEYPSRVKEEYKKIICCQVITLITRERKLANFVYLIACIWMFICVLIGGSLFSAALSTVDEADCGAASVIYNECGKSFNCSGYGGKSINLRGSIFPSNMFLTISNLNRSVEDEKMRHIIELACPELCYKNNKWDFDNCNRYDLKMSNICLNYDSEYCLVSELMIEGVYSLIELKRFDVGVVYAYFIQPFLPLILINILQNVADVALDMIRNTKSLGRMLIISVLTLISHLLYLIPIIIKYEKTFGKWNIFNFFQPLISSIVLLTILEFIMPFYRALYSNVPKITLGEKLLAWIKERKKGKKSTYDETTLEKLSISLRIKMHLKTIKQTLFNSTVDSNYSNVAFQQQNYSNLERNEEIATDSLNPDHISRLNIIFLLIGYLILLSLFEGICGIVMAFKIISLSRGYYICITIAYLITSFAFITILCMQKKEKTWIGFITQSIITICSFAIIVAAFTYVWITFKFEPYSF